MIIRSLSEISGLTAIYPILSPGRERSLEKEVEEETKELKEVRREFKETGRELKEPFREVAHEMDQHKETSPDPSTPNAEGDNGLAG